MGVYFKHTGDLSKTEKMFKQAISKDWQQLMDHYGRIGCDALAANTPVDTGKTASSWTYKTIRTPFSITLQFHNTNVIRGVNIALILQFGRGVPTGGFIEGRDYINPAISPLFDQMVINAWREVTGG